MAARNARNLDFALSAGGPEGTAAQSAATRKGEIVLDRVGKTFGGAVNAVDDLSLTIRSGEFVVLVGPSGCGKTTLLRMIAGLEDVTSGRILIDGRDVTDLAPRDRDIAMVFQNYALYPHMSVRQNLGYSLKVRKTAKAEIEPRVGDVATMLGLETLLHRKPSELSGGQRQRVAMGRAVVREPVAFLMDEPLSNLDAKLRVGMRGELARLHGRLGATTVYVTHDQVEAMTLGQRVAVMLDGKILQVDAPETLYRRPANLFVAGFMGSPAMNLVEATIADGEVSFGEFRVPVDTAAMPAIARTRRRVILGIRPESFESAGFAPSNLPRIEPVAVVVEGLGSDVHVLFEVNAPPVATTGLHRPGEESDILPADGRALFTARVDARTSAHAGSSVGLAIDPSRLHFFDPDSGQNLLLSPAA